MSIRVLFVCHGSKNRSSTVGESDIRLGITAGKPTYKKSDVGLGNAYDTADIDKPVSTAQQSGVRSAPNRELI